MHLMASTALNGYTEKQDKVVTPVRLQSMLYVD